MEVHGPRPLPQHRTQAPSGPGLPGRETLRSLACQHDLSRSLIRIWKQKFEAGAFGDEAIAANKIEAHEARVAARERLVGKQALEIEFLKGL